MKTLDIYVTHSNKIDYKRKLYEPLENSKIGRDHNLILPYTFKYSNMNTKDILVNSDLLIAEVTIPSTGLGIEIGRAECSGVKIVCLLKKGEKCSTSVKRICSDIIEYSDTKEMIYKITNYIKDNF